MPMNNFNTFECEIFVLYAIISDNYWSLIMLINNSSFLTSKDGYLMALKYNLASSLQYKKLINWVTIPFY